jgi:hypothetical protein
MKKTIHLLLAATLAASASLSAEVLTVSQKDKESILRTYRHWKSLGSGIGSDAIKSPFGRYLLLKNEDTLLGLKLEKHLPSVQEGGEAARYSWVHIVAGKVEGSGTFVIDEDPGSAAAKGGSYWIEIAGFKCQWSFGDWVYFDQNLPNMEVARTGFTEQVEIAKGEVKLWLSRKELESLAENEPELKLLERILAIEQGGTGRPATRPESKPEGGDKPQPEAERHSR